MAPFRWALPSGSMATLCLSESKYSTLASGNRLDNIHLLDQDFAYIFWPERLLAASAYTMAPS